jgi:F-type H+-transporting ATPase subunit b
MFTPEALASYLSLAIITILNLLVMYFILKRFLFKPILKVLRKRRELISGELKTAEEKRKTVEEKLRQADAKLEAATHEAAEILNEARTHAKSQSEALLTEAKRRASGAISKAETEINRMRISMLNEIRDEVADLAVSISAKVIGETFDEHHQRERIEQLLDQELAQAKKNATQEVDQHG